MSKDIINLYLQEFHDYPKEISEYKIKVLKDFYYENINNIFPVKRENFQIGVNNNHNLLFFRDKTFKNRELILNIIQNKTDINYRKEISYSFGSIIFDDLEFKEEQFSTTILIQKSIDNLNNEINNNINSESKKCCKLSNNCIII